MHRYRTGALALATLISLPAVAAAQQARAEPTAASITEEKRGLMAKAKIAAATALATARAAAPLGASFSKGELEEEGGKLIYTLQFKVAGKRGITEVNVDAITGSIVAEEDEEDEDGETNQAEEAKSPAGRKP